ncbi:MAG: hypothetical protein M3680_35505, partial [Myxococcota bacterium]|nr:hypothetical protein [Myxococcota bacterium]
PSLALVAIGVLALIVIGLLVLPRLRDGGTAPAPPRASEDVVTTPPVARRLFDVSLRSAVAISPDGRRLALASDRVEVREFDGPGVWSTPLLAPDDVSYLELRADEVWVAFRNNPRMHRWRYTGDQGLIPGEPAPAGHWHGATVLGRLNYQQVPERAVTIVANGREVRRWAVERNTEVITTSPSQQRVAYLEADRFAGRVVVQDLVTGRSFATPVLESPTALVWETEDTLIIGTGTLERPTLSRVALDGDGLGVLRPFYSLANGWFAQLAVHGKRLLFVEMGPTSRARTVDRGAQLIVRDLDVARVTVALGWIPETGALLTWSRSNRRLEKHRLDGALVTTAIELPSEPANATLAGDIVIAALRRSNGRELVAHSLSTGKRLWQHAPGTLLVVRCAADRQAPCYALQTLAGIEHVVALDPATGAIGARVPVHHDGGVDAQANRPIDDLAINASGDRLLLAGEAGVREIDAAGKVLETFRTPLANTRSVAYDPRGGFLAGGTLLRNAYQVGRMFEGQFTPIAQAENDLLSLVRPSGDGARVTILSRVYAPAVWELTLPP